MGSGDRTEVLTRAVLGRLEADLSAVLRRRPVTEAKLAGAVRALAPVSPTLRSILAEVTAVLVRRSGFDREIYGSAIRALTDAEDKRAVALLKDALSRDDAGGLATLSAACFSRDRAIAAPLAKVASGRNAHLAFGAEVARVARGESNGAHLVGLAPKIKESHRIALCVELFVPLARGAKLTKPIGGPLSILRDAERHLGRWLVLAEVATRAGDPGPLAEARSRALDGPASSRAAWSLVAWALEPNAQAPTARPTVEMVARLSDRPSADRDTTFLFRLAAARAPTVRPMLEGLTRPALDDEVAVRAAMHLARDHGNQDMRGAIAEIADSTKREDLRGVAAAALWDLGDKQRARRTSEALESTRALSCLTWGALVQAAAEGKLTTDHLLSEPTFRRVQCGWVE